MTTFRLILASIFFLVIGCKKEPIANNGKPNDKGILYDTANLGTRINIGEGGNEDVYWGRNAEEIFVNVYFPFYGSGPSRSSSETSYQVNLLTRKSSRIALTEGFVKGKNFDNSSMVMLGRMNNVYGYYLYHFNTGTYSLLLKAKNAWDQSAFVSGKAVFYSTVYYSGELAPCPLDSGSCGNWSPSVANFHFIDADSKKIVPLPNNHAFFAFSKTGKKTLLRGSLNSLYSGHDSSLYIFDNDRAMVIDSFNIDPVYYDYGLGGKALINHLYFDDETGVVKEAVVEKGEVVIINVKTKDIIQNFRPSVVNANESRVIWSHDGTKLYYTGDKDANLQSTTSVAIGIYDLISKKETVLEIGLDYIGAIIPSDDDKKILYWSGSWYIKKVQ